jgi:hypothetical protein
MEAFSDGVLAIAITLLVLEIGVPDGSEDDLLGALVDQWPSYLGYLVSFATIGALWIKHSAVTDYLTASDARLVRLNLLIRRLQDSLRPVDTPCQVTTATFCRMFSWRTVSRRPSSTGRRTSGRSASPTRWPSLTRRPSARPLFTGSTGG